MSFGKARDLLHLATMAAARYDGVGLDEIAAEFGVSHRTAQRMTDALETLFQCEIRDDDERRRRWKIREARLLHLPRQADSTLEGLELAIRAARDDQRVRHAAALSEMREALILQMKPLEARRAEAEAEAMLQALGHVARPGPRITMDPYLLDTVSAAIRGPFRLRVIYREDSAPRILEPHGILLGGRAYLVARQPAKGDQLIKFRFDRIRSAEITGEGFVLSPGFSIEDYAAQGFGVWHDPAQHGEVVWRFLPEVAEHAAGFRFHPRQKLEPQTDGSLIVRFTASGWLEMAWFLYQWGDKVEVIAPEGLRALVAGHQRRDFTGHP
ncbi:WYL domain-containing protein [Paracoccus sp. (in: a-proteobacteria)]|uniref:helix-turn-helix transcriptional regulator n=1 Tax=Paracoccus sp. TaxID=267 RepID=UPI00321FC729